MVYDEYLVIYQPKMQLDVGNEPTCDNHYLRSETAVNHAHGSNTFRDMNYYQIGTKTSQLANTKNHIVAFLSHFKTFGLFFAHL